MTTEAILNRVRRMTAPFFSTYFCKYNSQWLVFITGEILRQHPPMSFGAVVPGAICWLAAFLRLPQKQHLKA